MKTRNFARMLAMIMALCILFSACGQNPAAETPIPGVSNNPVENVQSEISRPATNLFAGTSTAAPEKGSYNEGVVLVKSSEPITEQMLSQLNCTAAEPLYTGSSS